MPAVVELPQDEPVIVLDRVGPLVDDDGSEETRLMCWQGRGGDVANVVGGSRAERWQLLAVIAGRLPALVGCCRIMGQDLSLLLPAVQRALRHRVVGSVFPGEGLFSHLSVRENVALPLLAGAVPDTQALQQAQLELERLGIGHLGDAQPAFLTGSQSQLARIAMALVHRPRLCVMDAPGASLSECQIAMLVRRLIEATRVEGACVVLSTEHPSLARLVSTTLSMPKGHGRPAVS